MTGLAMVLAALATYRLTLVITRDRVARPLRRRVLVWAGGRHVLVTNDDGSVGVLGTGDRFEIRCSCGTTFSSVDTAAAARVALADAQDHVELAKARASTTPLGYLITCPWCVSIYVGAAVSVTGWWWSTSWWWTTGTLALAASAFTGAAQTYWSPPKNGDS